MRLPAVFIVFCIAFFAAACGGSQGDTSSVQIAGSVADPAFDPAPGTYRDAQSVALSTTTAGAVIRYTTDGATPDETSALYEGPIPVSGTMTIRAVAYGPGGSSSGIATGRFEIAGWRGASRIWSFSSIPPILDMKVAMGGDGKAVLVWREQDIADAFFLYAGMYSGDVMDPPTKISVGSGNADYAQVAVDQGGNVIVVWSQPSTDSPYRIHAIRYSSDPGLWEDPLVISPETAQTDAKHPQIAMDNNGNAMVVWLQEGVYLTAPGNILSRRYSGSWEPVRQVTNYTSADDGCFFPSVAMDNTGAAIAVWVELFREDPFILRASRFRSGEWEPSREISAPFEWIAYPKVAMDGDGNAVAVWQRQNFRIDGDYQSILANSYSSISDAWGVPAEISASSAGNNSEFPQVAMDGGGAFAVWEQEVNGTTKIVAARRYASGSWDADVTYMDNGILGLAMAGGNGRYIAIWQQAGADGERVRSAGYSLSSGWQAPVSISEGYASSAAYPIGIAVNAAGDAIAVWQECSSPSPDSCTYIWANRYE